MAIKVVFFRLAFSPGGFPLFRFPSYPLLVAAFETTCDWPGNLSPSDAETSG